MKTCCASCPACPFVDRLEAVAFSGWSRGGVYKAAGRLEESGLLSSITSRHRPSCHPPGGFMSPRVGLYQLAQAARHSNGQSVTRKSRIRPLAANPPRASRRSSRHLPSRLRHCRNRLPGTVPDGTAPCRWTQPSLYPTGARWPSCDRAGRPTGPDSPSDCGGSWKGSRFGGILLLVPDEVRLRHARRLADRQFYACCSFPWSGTWWIPRPMHPCGGCRL